APEGGHGDQGHRLPPRLDHRPQDPEDPRRQAPGRELAGWTGRGDPTRASLRMMLRVLIVAAALAALVLTPVSARGQTFGNEISYGWAANSNYHAFAADFDGDGILDIGLQDTNDGSWFIKHGPSFADQAYYKWAGSTSYQAFAADMNGDGKADIGLR